MLSSYKCMFFFFIVTLLSIGTFNPCAVKGSVGYTVEEIDNNKDLLRHIATVIASEKHNIDFIKSELQKKHGKEALTLWSSYTKSTLPTVDSLKLMKISDDILAGRKIDAKFRKWLSNFVGKPSQTYFPETTINAIGSYILEAIQNGKMSVGFNKMLAENTSEAELTAKGGDIIITDHDFITKVIGQIYTKDSSGIVSSPQDKHAIQIIIDAGQYFEALKADKDALTKGKFQGKITTIY